MDENKLIDDMGGTSAVAALCDLTTGAISQWRTNGIPKPWLKYFREIRPDLFATELPEADRRKSERGTEKSQA